MTCYCAEVDHEICFDGFFDPSCSCCVDTLTNQPNNLRGSKPDDRTSEEKQKDEKFLVEFYEWKKNK